MVLQNTNNITDNHKSFRYNDARNKIKAKSKTKTKMFPPYIPLLARTQNLASHMPWVLKRYYTNEGRLILKEEKMKHHEYFRAHRANGRLTLHLVNVPFDGHNEYFEEATPSNTPHDEERIWLVVNDELSMEHDSDVVVVGGGRVKCLNCSSVRTGPTCNIFGLPVLPIRTVHS
ncbi:hypothetical protein AAZX31_13G069900 [Glycine max]